MTEPTAPEFVYKPLIATDEIRLLVLHPAADVSAPINYSLEHATLSQYEQDIINHYTALSYVWGDATDTREIHLEGFPFQITVSLESALRHIRDSKRECGFGQMHFVLTKPIFRKAIGRSRRCGLCTRWPAIPSFTLGKLTATLISCLTNFRILT